MRSKLRIRYAWCREAASVEAELGLLEEVHAALTRADTLGAAGDIYQGLAQALGGLTAWLRATAAGPRMVAQARDRAEGVWTGEQARTRLVVT